MVEKVPMISYKKNNRTIVRRQQGIEYGTVRLNFGKKYGMELHTVFSGTLRYGTRYGIIFSVPYSFCT